MASLVDAVEMATPAEICSKPLLDPVGPAADQYTPTAPTKEGHAESQARPGPTQEMENTADESTQPVGQAPGFDGGDTRATRAGNTPKAVPSQQDETLLVFSDMWNGTGTYDVNWSRCSSWESLQEVLINEVYQNDPEAQKCILDGSFKLTSYGTTINPGSWPSLLAKRYSVDIQLTRSPMNDYISNEKKDEDGDDDDDVNVTMPQCEQMIKYTLHFFKQSRYGYADAATATESFESPPLLKRIWNAKTKLPVLEEIQDVVSSLDDDFVGRGPRTNNRRQQMLTATDFIRGKYLKIHSAHLMDALRAVIKYTSRTKDGNRKGSSLGQAEFAYPYLELYHHLEELRDLQSGKYEFQRRHSEEYNNECSQHIDMLVKYLYSVQEIKLEQCEARWTRPVPVTTFMSYAMLLKPGTDVYVRQGDSLDAYVIESVTGGVSFPEFGKAPDVKPYTVDVWFLWSDGNIISRMLTTFLIPVFDNEREIRSLKVFPTRFHDNQDGGQRRKSLIMRGKKFFECTRTPKHMEYSGFGKGTLKEYQRERVVVDHIDAPWKENKWLDHPGSFPDNANNDNNKNNNENKTYSHNMLSYMREVEEVRKPGTNARAPGCECPACSELHTASRYSFVAFNEYDDIKPAEQEALTTHQYLLCARYVFGFVLKERAFELCDLEYLNEPIISEKAIDTLVMRPETKQAIKAIVETYTDHREQRTLFTADFIRGKGEGQIILLHGPPGTGKTLTAESVAEYTRRPLLSISAADLGHDAGTLEAKLLRFFRLAHRWDSVILLDEADVYLENRDLNDLQRNSVVSVFLRALDYFQGILFLTTNRVGQIDEAFQSRIHLSIGYPPLDAAAREQIWDNLFEKLKDDFETNSGPQITYDYDARNFVTQDHEINALEWNGREIRNAFQTVVALSIHDAKREAKEKDKPRGGVVPRIRLHHFRQLVRMSVAFDKYLQSTHENTDNSARAYKLGNRDDMFQSGKAGLRQRRKTKPRTQVSDPVDGSASAGGE